MNGPNATGVLGVPKLTLGDVDARSPHRYRLQVDVGSYVLGEGVEWLPLQKLRATGARFPVVVRSREFGALAYREHEVLGVREVGA